MADKFEESEVYLCVVCLGEDTKTTTPECGHVICMFCLSNETLSSNCTMCQEFYLLQTQDDMAMHLKGKGMCEKHRKKQKLFCDNNKTLLCMICSKSGNHKKHKHWPISVAAQHYRKKIQNNLEILCRMEREIQELTLKEKEEPIIWSVIWNDYKNKNRSLFHMKLKQIWEYLTGKKNVEEEIVIVGKENQKFYELYQRLKEMEDTQEQQIMQEKEEWETMMFRQRRYLINIIIEIEEKIKKPDVEMLQNVAEILERSLFSPNLEPFIMNVDTSYLEVVVEFLKVFQRYKLSEKCNFYNFSEEKKRAVRIISGFSEKKYLAYIFGSVQVEDVVLRGFIIEA